MNQLLTSLNIHPYYLSCMLNLDMKEWTKIRFIHYFTNKTSHKDMRSQTTVILKNPVHGKLEMISISIMTQLNDLNGNHVAYQGTILFGKSR